jgi:two-component system nitrogen regulation response regulator NtrX
MNQMNILIVDDEKNIRRSMEMVLTGEGHGIFHAGSAEDVWTVLHKEVIQVVFLDVVLPTEDGLSVLKKLKEKYPEIEVVMISGNATLSMAVEATREGAYDFLEKPLQKDKILLTLNHIIEKRKLSSEFESLKREVFHEYEMIGESGALSEVKKLIGRVADSDTKVLITGESGTGKELVAWAIHHQSPRRDKPFVKMNCAAIPEDLTESELFGYEKGAFTGASQKKEGKFHQANDGTLFLDEIGDMSLKVQTKVLRVLQDNEFERVGGKTSVKVDVRVIAATNRNLSDMVNQGGFREDLFFRLNVIPIHLPALRVRNGDIPILINHFLKQFCQKNNRRMPVVATEAMHVFSNYDWPGNIRELKNVVERLVIMAEGIQIELNDIPDYILKPSIKLPKSEKGIKTLKEFRQGLESEYIKHCLNISGGNVSRAAEMLGVERTNLHKKIKALGITGTEEGC